MELSSFSVRCHFAPSNLIVREGAYILLSKSEVRFPILFTHRSLQKPPMFLGFGPLFEEKDP